MRLSIVIVNHNGAGLLLSCLRSIREQKLKTAPEIVIVDNASTDNSLELIRKEFPDVIVIPQPMNLGFSRANNIGIQRSAGRYVCLVNSDVKIHQSCLEQLLECMERQPDIGIAGPRILNTDGSLQTSCRRFPTFWLLMLDALFLRATEMKPRLASKAQNIEVLSGCFMMIRREALDKIGQFDERFFFYSEDVDLCRRFHNGGWRVCYYAPARATHYGGGSTGRFSAQFHLQMLRAKAQYWAKYRDATSLSIYRLISVANHAIRLAVYSSLYVLSRKRRSTSRNRRELAAKALRFLAYDFYPREPSTPAYLTPANEALRFATSLPETPP
jgi:GT2 family glycosyltransferase